MTRFLSKSWIYIAALVFIAANLFLIYEYEFYWLLLLPVVIVLVYWAFFSLDTLLGFVVIVTPLSINVEDVFAGIGMYLPTDPLMFGLLLLFLFKLAHDMHFDSKVMRHPITIIILLQMSWMLITTLTSTMPLISLKSLVSKTWYLVSFYFLATQLFRYKKNLIRFQWWYVVPLAAVIIYTLIQHSKFNFASQPAHWVMEPFFKDHTIYGAALAIIIPPTFYLFLRKQKPITRIISFFILLILIVGMVFSYTRAAWLSLAGAFALLLIYKLRIKFKTLVLVTISLAALTYFSWNAIMWKLDATQAEASSSSFKKHLESVTNITTDKSNLERINRWVAAWGMFKEKPILGWGPNTYAFKYAPFQLHQFKTLISTNAGDMGNAHSEYIGPLAEEGFMGSLLFILLVVVTLYKGSNLYHRLPEGELKNIVLAILLGLTTYYIHGMMNNFLKADKLAVPFWAFTAMLVAIEVYHEKEEIKKVDA